jgi:membrane dipeptidase
MAKSPLIFDGHNDTLLDIGLSQPPVRDFFERSDQGHIDLPRARVGGLGGGLFAVFVPNRFRKGSPRPRPKRTPDGIEWPLPSAVEQPYALETTVHMAALLLRWQEEGEGSVAVATSASQVADAMANGVFATVLHAEGAEFIDPGFDAFEVLTQAGLKSLGLVWSRPNAFGSGVPFSFPGSPDQGDGLTDLGKELVRRCNRKRVLVDLSHLNERGFWDVEVLTDAPLVATHSAAHALCASPRNLTDRQLRAIASSGGIVGVNFHKGFLRSDGDDKPKTSLTEIARHARYIADLIGEDFVGLGSDFDGASMPEDLSSVEHLPRLLDALQQVGFNGDSLRKVANGNWLRVLRATWGE